MKKVFLVISIILAFSLPLVAHGDYDRSYNIDVEDGDNLTIEYDGLVPCGRCLSSDDVYNDRLDDIHNCESGTTYVPCDLCHLFITFDNIIGFILTRLIPPLALLVIVIGGVLYLTAAQNPDRAKTAKKTVTGAVIGLIVAYTAYAAAVWFSSSLMDWDIGWSGGIETQHICELEIEEDPFGEENGD